jgi:hypothetical protein
VSISAAGAVPSPVRARTETTTDPGQRAVSRALVMAATRSAGGMVGQNAQHEGLDIVGLRAGGAGIEHVRIGGQRVGDIGPSGPATE